jgi:L-threonylcarbamoyladenylate synthase
VDASGEQVTDPRLIRVPDDEQQWESLLEVAAQVVGKGDLIVLPTDTLYGVGCDPFNRDAVDKLFAAKARGRELPLPVLVHSRYQAEGLVRAVDERARTLIGAFWPGPLTIVLRESEGIGWYLGRNRGTVALRMPKQTFALALLQRTGPLAVTSANRSGEPTPPSVAGIMTQLDDGVGVYFDAGLLPVPSEPPDGPEAGGTAGDPPPASTIVDLTGPRARLLREGAIPPREIERVLDEPLVAPGST